MAALLSFRKLCRVQGGFKEGRQPFVNFHHARYTGDELNRRHDLVGKSIQIVNQIEDDARVVMASTSEGDPIGILRASPPWHRLPHSLQIRTAIARLVQERRFVIANGGDAIVSFMDYVEALPKRKLPVHPTYLAVQRVLAEQARGAEHHDEDLQLARNKLTCVEQAASTEAAAACASGQDVEPPLVVEVMDRAKTLKPQVPVTVTAKRLPPLRMAKNG
ncbi:hypothetical protein [Pseudorhodoferax sp. LjRoot39]|uniref:hypothetical protein n=1 Tax=Pseudorhodoferax sp. LjRoot39 TaxID=3342328 RepID=UPI003F4FAB20